MKSAWILTLLCFPIFTQSANILFLLPIASKSHVNVFEPLISALGERGHNIVSLSPSNSTKMPPTVRTITVRTIEEIFTTMESPFKMRERGIIAAFSNMSLDYMFETCEAVYDSKEVIEMFKTEKFDLVVIDILMNYCMLGILPKLGAPFIHISTLVVPAHVVYPLGNRLPASFVPSPFLQYSHQMNFLERVVNFSFTFFIDIFGLFVFIPSFEKIYQKKLGIDTGIYEIDRNVSMIFVNSHFSLTYPRPYLPSVVDVGGMHIRPSKPLPKDLEDFISGGKDGVIYFSFGSIAQGKDMPEKYRKIFVNVFSRLKERVLWKWESEEMEDLPKNVKLGKWLPQQDILDHKNVKLFIGHGGLLSVQESIYNGVPLLCIPLFADQDLNSKQAEKAGFALTIEILDMTEEILESKIKEMLGSPVFKNRVEELSSVWKDQPMTPLETAVFWSEYVIRHKGASLMRSAARDLNFFQYHSLDVIAFLLSILVAFIFGTKCALKCIWNCLCSKKTKSSENSKAKKNTGLKSKKTN